MIDIETHDQVLNKVGELIAGTIGQKTFLRDMDEIYTKALGISEAMMIQSALEEKRARLARARRTI